MAQAAKTVRPNGTRLELKSNSTAHPGDIRIILKVQRQVYGMCARRHREECGSAVGMCAREEQKRARGRDQIACFLIIAKFMK